MKVYFVKTASSDYRQAKIDAREGRVTLSDGMLGQVMVTVVPTLYLVLAKHIYNGEVQFLTAQSLTAARKELARFSEAGGYMTIWKSEWATKDDTKKYARSFSEAKLSGFEYK